MKAAMRSFYAMIDITGRARVYVIAKTPEEALEKIVSGDWEDSDLIDWEGDIDRDRPPKIEEND